MQEKNIHSQSFAINRQKRNHLFGHRSFVIWFTGLSGAGKTTLANQLEQELFKANIHTYTLDGDNIRNGLCKDLDFSTAGRQENIRRIGEVARLMMDAGLVVIASFISPFEKDRKQVKELIGEENFIEIHVSTNLETCEKRDVKGLYAKARKGEIQSFTGINSPYEIPKNPSITIDAGQLNKTDATQKILTFIKDKL